MRNIEEYTKEYNISGFENYQVMYRRKKILEVLDRYSPKRILEIGCGMEPLFQYLKCRYELYCVVEPSKYFFENALKLSKGKNVICYNDFFYPTKELINKQFDFIICSGLLHELEQPEKLLEGIVKISDNAIVHINVPNAKSLHRLIAVEMGSISNEYEFSERNMLLQQHKVFDLNMLIESVTRVGLRVIESGSYFVKPFTHNQMYQLIKNNIISEETLEGFYNISKYIPDYGSEIFVNCQIQ